MKKFGTFAAALAALLVIAACNTVTTTQPTEIDPIPAGVARLVINPGSVVDGRPGVDHYFTIEAEGIETGVDIVHFAWSFTEGQAGQRIAKVTNGKASIRIEQRYGEEGIYALMANVSKPKPRNTFEVLAASRAVIRIGAAEEREQELLTCDDWQSANSGGRGGTEDRWDISSVPAGAVFDIRYQMYQIPDMLLVEYPQGVIVHNTGWRGDSRYNDHPNHIGGVEGPGRGQVDAVITKVDGQDAFNVVVFGPTRGTLWEYDVRCYVPEE